jgi:hypothetical protein
MRSILVRWAWRCSWFWIVQDCSGLFRLIGEFRAEGKAGRLARKMLDVVGSSVLLVVTCAVDLRRNFRLANSWPEVTAPKPAGRSTLARPA